MRAFRSSGFTLIELMIVVAIVAILAAIAVPNYREYVLRAGRGDAKTVLLEISQAMERNYTEANRYDKNAAGATMTVPFSQSPKQGTAKYLISFAAGSPTSSSFTVQAVPQGAQANDSCGTLTLNNLGQQGATGVSGATEIANCWQR
ncbi:type IV pilin protein [Uliginosibacterium paludis]|uniref:Type IV pilin protein n=1 Tax=Uliginosibacterium paludis TaxID=1615952 RepID=A0ABV2CL86_9RHOO